MFVESITGLIKNFQKEAQDIFTLVPLLMWIYIYLNWENIKNLFPEYFLKISSLSLIMIILGIILVFFHQSLIDNIKKEIDNCFRYTSDDLHNYFKIIDYFNYFSEDTEFSTTDLGKKIRNKPIILINITFFYAYFIFSLLFILLHNRDQVLTLFLALMLIIPIIIYFVIIGKYLKSVLQLGIEIFR